MNVVVITRPEKDALTLVEAVAARGLRPLVEPMLTIDHLPGPEPDLTGAQALLFTSANGVRAFGSRTDRRDLPAFAVGEGTAQAAKEKGFRSVTSAAGAAKDLADLVGRRCAPNAGRLVHPSGEHVATDLGDLLGGSGFSVERLVVYVARPSTQFSTRLLGALLAGTVLGSLFFSPRGGAAFAGLVRRARLEAACRRVAALCISPAVAESLKDVHWRTVAAATRPTQDAMIDLLDQERARTPHHDL